MKNIIKCNRCGGYFSSEFSDSHNCLINLEYIPTIFQYEIVNDENESVIVAKGWNDVLYSFVKTERKSKVVAYLCKHLKGIMKIPIVCYTKIGSNVFEVRGWDGVAYKIYKSKSKPPIQILSDEFLQGKSSDTDLTEPPDRNNYIVERNFIIVQHCNYADSVKGDSQWMISTKR